MAVDPRWTENQQVSRAASGSADELVPALERIVTSGHWREFVHPMKGLQRFKSFADYCDQFLRLSAEAVEALLDRTQSKAAARTVRQLLREGIEAVGPSAGPGRGKVSDTNLSQQPDSTYVVARLLRDDPELAQQVVAGDITPNAAAIQAGIRHKYARIRTDNPQRAITVLLHHYTRDQLLAALEAP